MDNFIQGGLGRAGRYHLAMTAFAGAYDFMLCESATPVAD
jgi:hypothetical protein